MEVTSANKKGTKLTQLCSNLEARQMHVGITLLGRVHGGS
jgi:hypothetical protein